MLAPSSVDNTPLLPGQEQWTAKHKRRQQAIVFVLTFLSYASFHMSRKPPSVVKSVLHPSTDYDPDANPGWAPFNQDVVPEKVFQHGYSIRDSGNFTGHYSCTRLPNCTEYQNDAHPNAILTQSNARAFNGTVCNDSWILIDLDDPTLGYFAQTKTNSPIPLSTVDDKGKWSLCAPNTCTCKEDDQVSATPDMMSGNVLLGELDTVFLFFYSIGLFVSGHVGDRVNLRYFLTIGMVGSGVCGIALGLAHALKIHSMAYFIFFNAVGGMFQSIGWPSVLAIMSRWFGKGARGLVMGVWNAHTSIGNILGSVIASASLNLGMHGKDWPSGLIIPGLIISSMGIVVFAFLEPSPPFPINAPEDPSADADEHEHLTTGEVSIMDDLLGADSSSEEDDVEAGDETGASVSEHSSALGGFSRALFIPGVITYAISLAFAKLTAYSLIYWGPYYLTHVGYSSKTAGFMSTFFDIGGIVGGIVAGYVSDRYKVRALVAFTFLVLSVPGMWLYFEITNSAGVNDTVNILAMICVGSLINGPYSLITTAVSADLGSHPSLKKDSQLFASVTGIIDGTGSLGATVQGVLIGLISTSSWENVFRFLMVSNCISAFLILKLVRQDIRHLSRQ